MFLSAASRKMDAPVIPPPRTNTSSGSEDILASRLRRAPLLKSATAEGRFTHGQ